MDIDFTIFASINNFSESEKCHISYKTSNFYECFEIIQNCKLNALNKTDMTLIEF